MYCEICEGIHYVAAPVCDPADLCTIFSIAETYRPAAIVVLLTVSANLQSGSRKQKNWVK